MTTLTEAVSLGPIEPDVLYPIMVARRLLGWGVHSMRAARRNGLRVRYTAGRAYVLGHDVIAYVSEKGSDEKPGFETKES